MINDRFKRWCELFAKASGTWQHFTFWLLALAVWIVSGIPLHWSDSWQLWWNGLTTTFELFLGLALLVDGALQIDLLTQQHERLLNIEEQNARLLERLVIDIEHPALAEEV